MTKFSDLWKHRVHKWIKPTGDWMYRILASINQPLVEDREKHGWKSRLVQKLRRVYDRWEEKGVMSGGKTWKNEQRFTRAVFDMICIRMEVEEPLTSKRWEQLIDIAKEEELI